MIKAASCGEIELVEGDISSWLQRCAAAVGAECSLDEYANPIDLVEACTQALDKVPYDLVICAVDLVGVSGIHVVSELKALHQVSDELRVVLCSKDSEHAYDAQALKVDGYCVEPVSQADFDRVVGRNIREIAQLHGESAVIRCRDRVHRVAFPRVSYAETSGHNQVIHYAGGSDACEMRGSSRELYAILEGDGRFFKVGSSYIVNLDYVLQLDSKDGTALLADGTRIPIPVRNRKPFEQAMCARGIVPM